MGGDTSLLLEVKLGHGTCSGRSDVCRKLCLPDGCSESPAMLFLSAAAGEGSQTVAAEGAGDPQTRQEELG